MVVGRPHTFFPELESLRGVAALSVVVLHIILYMMFLPSGAAAPIVAERIGAPAFWTGLAGLAVFNGRAAVPLFFVLSGFVMSLGLETSGGLNIRTYAVFLVRRFFRLIPPLWASILFGCVVQAYLGNVYTLSAIIRFLTLTDISINSVEWSLVLEIAACLVYPVLLFGMCRLGVWTQVLALGCAVLLQGFHLVRVHYGDTNNDLPIYCFCLGIAVPTLGRALVETTAHRVRTFLAALALIGMMSTAFVHAFVEFYPTLLNQRLALAADNFAVPSAAFYLIAWLVYAGHPLANNFLKSRPAAFLGTTSYSMYILHGQIMAVALQGVAVLDQPALRLLVGLVTVVPATLVLSYLGYRYVERPSIALGKRVASKLDLAFRRVGEAGAR